ncbi:sigma-70 family RNA polymerase sigma factor [Nocardiopsis sp. LOL_012]|uniref:sigma-70 family RNA polymerase sigma factor n=1 Tax=Nocardiopsis sp. LOL_012 TaxID=3345409 RepID=UPI003A8417E0
MTRGSENTERGVPAQADVEALYDAFAPALYRYAWTLLGGTAVPGPERDEGTAPADLAAEAVHDGLVAAVALTPGRDDPDDRGPRLYALVRSACQHRGFALTCPYTHLATVPAEEPVARMFSRLPASHRELVELNLRHALPPAAIARVLGLDGALCSELSRSAIRRAFEGLAEHDAFQDPEALWRTQVQQVSSALALLRPPGPPPGLRGLVVGTCLDPALAGARARIADAMRPLTAEGYPVHRGRAGGPAEEPEPETSEPPAEPLPRALPGDRVTTRDHPVREEVTTALDAPDAVHAPEQRSLPRHWPLSAVSGLVTIALAVVLWSWASALGAPPTVIGTEAPEAARSPQVHDVPAPPSPTDTHPGEGTLGNQSTAGRPQDTAPSAEDSPSGAPESPSAADAESAAPASPPEPASSPPPSPETATAPQESPSGGTADGGQDTPDGLIGGLLDLLLGGE